MSSLKGKVAVVTGRRRALVPKFPGVLRKQAPRSPSTTRLVFEFLEIGAHPRPHRG